MIRKLLQREIRREIREGGYTDLVLAGIESTVEGGDVNALVTGALESAAGLWGRTLAAASVTGTGALTARVRHRIGRSLIRTGEAVFEIRTDGGAVALVPASAFEVLEGWRYRLDFNVPPGKLVQRTVPRGRVCHFIWSEDPREPWRGVSPLGGATKLRTILARVEERLSDDLNTPVAHLVPIPSDGGDSKLDSLRADIGNAKGGAVLAEATSAGWDEGRASAGTRNDWRAERLGAERPRDAARGLEGDHGGRLAGVRHPGQPDGGQRQRRDAASGGLPALRHGVRPTRRGPDRRGSERVPGDGGVVHLRGAARP